MEPPPGDGIGDLAGGEGEPLEGSERAPRAGRLREADDATGRESDVFAEDVGIDGGAASAEEAAVHVTDEPDVQGRGPRHPPPTHHHTARGDHTMPPFISLPVEASGSTAGSPLSSRTTVLTEGLQLPLQLAAQLCCPYCREGRSWRFPRPPATMRGRRCRGHGGMFR
ncbi:DUF5709 domain-containing protein [Streptomyces microflavus]|uniref:DUF5709 domain-containing protein n=1 Tax=Streptomyces microflavus TaxID=1919 RepID=UPI0038650835